MTTIVIHSVSTAALSLRCRCCYSIMLYSFLHTAFIRYPCCHVLLERTNSSTALLPCTFPSLLRVFLFKNPDLSLSISSSREGSLLDWVLRLVLVSSGESLGGTKLALLFWRRSSYYLGLLPNAFSSDEKEGYIQMTWTEKHTYTYTTTAYSNLFSLGFLLSPFLGLTLSLIHEVFPRFQLLIHFAHLLN